MGWVPIPVPVPLNLMHIPQVIPPLNWSSLMATVSVVPVDQGRPRLFAPLPLKPQAPWLSELNP